MTKMILTEKKENSANVRYILATLREIFNQTDSVFSADENSCRIRLVLSVSDFYKDAVLTEVFDKIADVIAINYKYVFFKKHIIVNGLSAVEKELLFASLIAADIDEDKKYIVERLKNFKEIAIDGIYDFKLRLLKQKWREIVSYIPSFFTAEQLKDFITYLLEGRNKKVYVDTGRVYDLRFRLLKRGDLMNGNFTGGRIVREIILSGGGIIELSGKLPEIDEFYLKEYYGGKVTITESY